MKGLGILLTVVGAGIAAFAVRLSFIVISDRVELPQTLRRALRFVPAAVLLSLAAPSLLYVDGALALSVENERLLAGAFAALVAWRTRSVLPTIGAGMASLWVLQAVM